MEPSVSLCQGSNSQLAVTYSVNPQICFIRTKKGEVIKAFFDQFQQLSIYVNQKGILDNNWRAIKTHDFPKELQKSLSFEKVQSLLEGCSLRVKQYSNGDLKLILHAGLLGGMLSRKDLAREVKKIEGHQQLINALDRSMQISPQGITKTSATLIRFGSVGAGVGIGWGTATIVMRFTALGGPIGVGVGLIASGLLLWCANRYIKNCKEKAEKLAREIEEISYSFDELILLAHDPNFGKESLKVRQKAKESLNNLKQNNYLVRCDSLCCDFHEDKFSEAKKFYDKSVADQLVIKIKFLILCTLVYIPNDQRPVDRLICLMREVALKTDEKAVKNYTNVIIATLYLERGSLDSSLAVLREIDKDSDLKKYADDFIADIAVVQQNQQRAIAPPPV